MGAMERQLARVAGIIGGREAAISRRRLGGLAASVAVLGPIAGAGGKKKKEKKKKSQPPQPRNRFRFVTTWGVFGTGNGELNFPMGVAVDSAGNVFVLDTNNDRIQRFEQADEDPLQYDSVTTRGVSGVPEGITVDGSGNVHVAATEDNRIRKFDGNGTGLGQFGTFGFDSGEFDEPSDVAVTRPSDSFHEARGEGGASTLGKNSGRRPL